MADQLLRLRAVLALVFVAVVGLAITIVMGACSRAAPPHATPEGVVRAFVAAANRGDVSGMRALAISPERLRQALTCQPDDRKVDVIEAVASAREAMVERAGMRVIVMSVFDVSRRIVAVGHDYLGCRANEELELRRMRMNLSVDDAGNGERREKTEEGDVIHLDGRWWLVIPS